MFCKKCGNALPDGAAFCQKCGTKVNENSVPTYIAPARAKAPFPLKYIVIPVVILAVAAIAIVSMVTPDKSPDSSGGGITINNTSTATSESKAENVQNNGNLGGNTQQAVSEEKFTSPVTGAVFSVPEIGRAHVSLNGIEKIMPAENTACTVDVYKCDNYFNVYFDGLTGTASNLDIKYSLSKGGDWEAGKSYSLEELKDQNTNDITATGFYEDNYGSIMFSWAQYGNVFKDARFTIIDRNKSTGEMKWYFYVKMSSDGATYTVEGVAHTIFGEKTTSVSDSYLENGGDNTGGNNGEAGGSHDQHGNTKCGVCLGKGKVKCSSCDGGFQMCTSCNGVGTYYSYAQKRDVVCTRCQGGGKTRCGRCSGTGYKSCGSCGGDGYR